MQLMAELSLYPLSDAHLEPIDWLLERLNAVEGLDVTTNRMSTLVHGDQALVLATLDRCLTELHERFGKAALVAKFLPGAERSLNGYR